MIYLVSELRTFNGGMSIRQVDSGAPQIYGTLRRDFTGLAINTAMSGIVVIDIDKGSDKDGWAGLLQAGIELPKSTMKATSQSGGEHWFYRKTSVPVDQSSSLLAQDVDVRGT